MSRSLSIATLEALNAPETDRVFLSLLTITEAQLPDPIRVVNNHETITSRGDDFLPFWFDLDLPSDQGEAISSVRLRIDNVDRQIVEAVRLASGRPVALLEVVLDSDPDQVEASFSMTLHNASYDAQTVTAELKVDDVGSLRCPNHIVTPQNYPDLF